MIKFKKLTVLLLSGAMCASLAFVFTACNSGNTQDGEADGGEQSQTGETEVTYVGKTYGVNVEDVKYYTYYSDGSKSEAWDESVSDYYDFVEVMAVFDLKLTFTDETGASLYCSDGASLFFSDDVVTITSNYTLSDGVFVFTDCVSSEESNYYYSAEECMNKYMSFGWNGTTVTFKLFGDYDDSAGEEYYAECDMYEITE